MRRRKADPELFDLKALCDATDGFSGAEIEAAIVAALCEAHAVKQPLTALHILAEVARTRPLSVVMAEKVEDLRTWAAERAVSAG